jgi:hypothetical protein
MKWRKKPYLVEAPLQHMLATGLLGGRCNLESLLREWDPADAEAIEVVRKLRGYVFNPDFDQEE